MSSFLLALALLSPQSPNSTAALEGVWVNADGRVLFAGNNRLDWRIEDRYYSAMMATVPDGTLLGRYVAGREVHVNFFTYDTQSPATASAPVEWRGDQLDLPFSYRDPAGTSHVVHVPHLGPDYRTFAKPVGEVRLAVKTLAGNGRPAIVVAESTPDGSRIPIAVTYARAMSMDALSLAGKFGDKDLTVEIQGDAGRTGSLRGSLTYLGKRLSLSGRRVMGRGGILLFDDSRSGLAGGGYVSWSPSPDRALDIRNRNSTETDQIDLFFNLKNGSVATGIHRTLKRVP